MWYIVKGKGDYRMKPKSHKLTEETGEGGTRRSECGQFFIPITPMKTSSYPEVYCRKCVIAAGQF